MLRDNVQGRTLRYDVLQGKTWLTREKELSRPLTEATLRDPATNLEWAAALLAMWREQHHAVEMEFDQVVHRHYVSHFFWGDSVGSDREEDRVLTDRRRLLAYYGVEQKELTQSWRNVVWGSPLEAGPRVVSSAPGASRDEGLRRHKGVDVEAVIGEPVLAMADGVVWFAGVDMPGQGSRPLEPQSSRRVPKKRMGRGGIFVCIDHQAASPDELFLRSCYMHLDSLRVKNGDLVTRGQPIGTAGRTGVKHSPPHLHLEIKSDRRIYDARDVVPGILIGEPPPEPRRRRRNVPRS
jgi:murein DD-endopeptidase MepM/ murein hydrolase activator NlpD